MTRPTQTSARSLLLVLAAALVLVVAACGDDDSTTTPVSTDPDASQDSTPPADAGGSDGAVTIEDFSYDPMDITASPGQEIRFTNEDGTSHTATAKDGSFNTDTVKAGESATATAPDEPGEYPFVCSFHPFMKGTLVVE